MFQHEDCRGFDILNHAIRLGSAEEEEWRLATAQPSTESSQVSPAVVSPQMQSSNSFQFPWKLYDMLERAEQDGLQDIVAWQGEKQDSFKVFKPQLFVDKLMPQYFKQTKYKSFQRQLNLYGFTRINEGPGKGGYKHKYFLRGNKALCQYISRQSGEEICAQASGASVSSSSNNSLHAPQGASTTYVPLEESKNAATDHTNTVSANTNTNTNTTTNQSTFKPATSQVCDREINEQYKALIQKDYQFPWKLYEMLEKENDYENIVSWQPGNKCFRVHDPNQFVSTVMPRFFKQTKYKSFQRQLNLYGFTRVDEGPNKGSYMHKLFQKDRRDLLSGMNRQKNPQYCSRSQATRSGNCSTGREISAQLFDASEHSTSSALESQCSQVKCIDCGIPTILQSISGDVETKDERLCPPDRSNNSGLKWHHTTPNESSDWTIVVLHNDTFERESFHVHQRVLSCGERKSNYFARLFEGSSAPSTESDLVLGTAEVAVFPHILDYIYYDIKPKLDMRVAFSYFMMGKSLGIDRLRQYVIDYYRNAMGGDNIRDFIQVVCDFDDNELLESAIDCFAGEMFSMDVALAGKLKPQMLHRILYRSKDHLERVGFDAATTSLFVAESLHNHACLLSREQLLCMVDDKILTSIDAVAAIKLLATYTIVCDGEQQNCEDLSLRHRCVTAIAKDWSRMRSEFEKSPALVKALKTFSSELLVDILMKATQ